MKSMAMAGSVGSGLTSLGLIAQNNARAQSFSDYKALVCVYLYGGNDGYNTLVPYEVSAHAQYLSRRPQFQLSTSTGLGIARTALMPLQDAQSPSSLGLHPSLVNIHSRWNQGQVAWVQNVGNLVEPVTRSNFQSVVKPAALGSHNDQQEISMIALQEAHAEGAERGWFSRLLERAEQTGVMQSQDNRWAKMSFGGRNKLLASPGWPEIVLSPNQQVNLVLGNEIAPLISDGSASSRLLNQAYSDALATAYQDAAKVNSIFSVTNTPAANAFVGVAGNNLTGLHAQLYSVARVIESCSRLQTINRQGFFVGLGGFDTHEAQYVAHSALLSHLDAALHGFFAAMEALGLSRQVTAFTLSDFGRTLSANASHGTDHAWASHLMVMGGAVRGGLYGRAANFSPTSEDVPAFDTNFVIPSTSINQYGATLALWMGLNNSDLNVVFPDLRNFSQANLGFMNS